MIGWLGGRVICQLPSGAIVVNVQGVGYEIYPAGTAIEVGHEVELFVYTSVRDDAIVLFGFDSLREREVFEMLLGTPGVGPATALAALRTMSIDQLGHAIEAEDVARISSVPGIGPKTAGRIVLELRGKIIGESGEANSQVILDVGLHPIVEALRALGYDNAEIREAMRDLELPPDESTALRTVLARMRHA